MKKLVLLSFFTFSTFFTFAQEVFEEGVITFGAEWQIPDGMPEQMKEAMPKEIKTYVKGSKSATNMDLSMGGMNMSMKVLYFTKPLEMLMLIDAMGQKMGIKTTEADMQKIKDTLQVSYEYLDFKKTIAGYECQKVIMLNKSTGEKAEMFVTNKIVSPGMTSDLQFKDLKGFPLEYVQNQSGMKVKMTATSIKKEAVDEKMFEIPTDFNIMTLEEASKMGRN